MLNRIVRLNRIDLFSTKAYKHYQQKYTLYRIPFTPEVITIEVLITIRVTFTP